MFLKGLMGHGIAQTIAQKGIKVTAVESKPEALQAGMDRFVALSV